MRLSAIVPAYNSEATLDACLASLRAALSPGDELIVVDDASADGRTAAAARRHADEVIGHTENLGRSRARSTGIRRAKGDILLFVDSDVVVPPDAGAKVKAYFQGHPDVDALSGLLSKRHPNPDFFSQYKNLYMHYIFRRLPERVNFLYGSIHAVRRGAIVSYHTGVPIADDTALGQQLVQQGRRLAFLKDLEVVHLKRYGLVSLLANDFRIPFDWSAIFLKYRGWRQLGHHRGGYLHSPPEQLASVLLAPLIVAVGVTWMRPALAALLPAWALLNASFLAFLFRERGPGFGVRAVFFTFLDHCVMASGIACGFASYPFLSARKAPKSP